VAIDGGEKDKGQSREGGQVRWPREGNEIGNHPGSGKIESQRPDAIE